MKHPRALIGAALLVLVGFAAPAHAGFDVTLYGAQAYAFSGGCAPAPGFLGDGTNSKTLPVCSASSVGSFFILTNARVAGSAPTFRVANVNVLNTTEPGATSDFQIVVECTAIVPGANGISAVTFGDDATLTKDMDADATCADVNDTCRITSASDVAIFNRATGANCASTTCNDSPMVCKFTVDGTVANTDTTVAFVDSKLTILP